VFSRLPKLLMAVALVSSIGLHWAFFQSVAWVGMVITYSQCGSLTQALVKTFDGKHPCSLCNQIAQAQKSQKKSDRHFEVKKLEFISAGQVIALAGPTHFQVQSVGDSSAPQLSETPPVPPPRHA
jgi:hypothetical protein